MERQFLQLLHSGILGRQKAILLGSFTNCTPDNTSRYPYSMPEVVEAVRSIVSCPVLEGLPFGHVARKLTLPFGVTGELELSPGSYTLSWPGLRPA